MVFWHFFLKHNPLPTWSALITSLLPLLKVKIRTLGFLIPGLLITLFHLCPTLPHREKLNLFLFVYQMVNSLVLNSVALFFPHNLVLHDVLYIPNFSFNLVSVTKLTSSLSCQLCFSNNHCLIQEIPSLRMIGKAEAKKGLYVMMIPGLPQDDVPTTILAVQAAINMHSSIFTP